MTKEFEAEVARLEGLIKEEKNPNPLEVAILEGLKSRVVRDVLDPLFEKGVVFRRARLQPAGTLGNVVQFEILTEWAEGKGGGTPAPHIGVVCEVTPPRVITAQTGYRQTRAEALGPEPAGATPVALRHLRTVSATEAKKYQREADSALQDFLTREQLYEAVETAIRTAQQNGHFYAGTAQGLTCGTHCKGAFCTDMTSDDFDDPG